MLLGTVLAVSARVNAQELKIAATITGANTGQINELHEKACDNCIKVLPQLKNNEQDIWQICDFCLELTKVGAQQQYDENKIRMIKKNLLRLLERSFESLSAVKTDNERIRALNNIVAVLEYLKKINAKFSPNNLSEAQKLSKNIKKFKMKRKIIEDEMR